MALWYHFDLFCGREFSGHVDVKLDDSQLQPFRDSFFKFGLDLTFNEKFSPWTIEQDKKLNPSAYVTTTPET